MAIRRIYERSEVTIQKIVIWLLRYTRKSYGLSEAKNLTNQKRFCESQNLVRKNAESNIFAESSVKNAESKYFRRI